MRTPEPMPVMPKNGAAVTAADRDPDEFPDVEEFDLPESPFPGMPE